MGAGDLAPTIPYCRACGWDFIESPNRDDDSFCDSCGDALIGSIGTPLLPPSGLVATPGSSSVDFTWAANPEAGSTDIGYIGPEGGAWTVVSAVTSPSSIATVDPGIGVCAQVRSVIGGVVGPWSAEACAVSV